MQSDNRSASRSYRPAQDRADEFSLETPRATSWKLAPDDKRELMVQLFYLPDAGSLLRMGARESEGRIYDQFPRSLGGRDQRERETIEHQE